MQPPQTVYVINRVTKTMHRVYVAATTGKLHSVEECNVDDIPDQRRAIFTAPQMTFTSPHGRISVVHPCKRCFPRGLEKAEIWRA